MLYGGHFINYEATEDELNKMILDTRLDYYTLSILTRKF